MVACAAEPPAAENEAMTEPLATVSAAPPTVPIEAIRGEFPILEKHDLPQLVLPRCTVTSFGGVPTGVPGAVAHDGASAWYEHWLGRIDLLRGKVARFLGAETRELALMPSTSAALSVIGESVDYSQRNRIVCTELDFPTLAYQWMVKPEVEVVVLESPDGIRVDLEQYESAVDEHTAFVATSHVFFTTGSLRTWRVSRRSLTGQAPTA